MICIFISGTIIGAVFFSPEISEAVYSIPPTPAWQTIQLNDTLLTQGDQISANSSNTLLHIISDGSIEINRGVGGSP